LDRICITGTDASSYAEADEVELHRSLQGLMPQHDQTSSVANQLETAIERILATLDNSLAIRWKTASYHGIGELPSPLEWMIPATVQTHRNGKMTKGISIRARRVQADLPEGVEFGNRKTSWTLYDRGRLYSVLSLWLYTLAERANVLRITDELEQKVEMEPVIVQSARAMPFMESAYVRIVANDPPRLDDADSLVMDEPPHQLTDWLGRKVVSCYSHNGICDISHNMEAEMRFPSGHDWPIFGAHLSALSSRNHYVYTNPATGLVTQCAQEILSILILVIAAQIESIEGDVRHHKEEVEYQDRMRRPRVRSHELFDALAHDILGAYLAHDINEACALVIPAFAHYKIMPR
jgi:hypothetical protein